MAILGTFYVHDAAKITVETIATHGGPGRWHRIKVDNLVLANVFHTDAMKGELPEIVTNPREVME